jgi:hypothetical protein
LQNISAQCAGRRSRAYKVGRDHRRSDHRMKCFAQLGRLQRPRDLDWSGKTLQGTGVNLEKICNRL